MFKHQHPYPPIIYPDTEKLIVGTLPPPRFTTRELKPGDVDFAYGSIDGQLWKILSRIFGVELLYENSEKAKEQRSNLLIENKIGICDMVECAFRDKIDASDLGIKQATFRPLIPLLKKNSSIRRILFTGGNSKGGPEYFFRKYLKQNFPEIKLERINAETPKIHQFELEGRKIETVSLTAPSGSANRAVGSMDLYKELKAKKPEFTTIDFRVMQYSEFFTK